MSSDDQDQADDAGTGRGHSVITDPHSTTQAGGQGLTWHPARQSDAEREHNAQMLGVTYRERVSRGRHNQCIILCVNPHPGRLNHCPSCYGKAVPYDIYQSGFDPAPGRAARFGRWVGEWAAAVAEAFTFPFRVGREHTAALVRDLLQDAIQAGLRAEIVEICPKCREEEPANVS